MGINQLKVFGERNSGTNWVEELLLINFTHPLVHHRGIIQKYTSSTQKDYINSKFGVEKKIVQEMIFDGIFQNHAADLFGWKHTCVDDDLLSKHSEFSSTGFIFLVKHPYSFVKSLYRRPYHMLTNNPSSILEFIVSPWPTVQRDNIGSPKLASPIELWNYKVGSYVKFVSKRRNGVILRYEDILRDNNILFDNIEHQFFVTANSRKKVFNSTKSDCLNTDDYKSKYLTNMPSQGLDFNSIKFMRRILDQQLVTQFGYEI